MSHGRVAIVTAQHNDYIGPARNIPGRGITVSVLRRWLHSILDVSSTPFKSAFLGVPIVMTARIFKPAKNAMQSGRAISKEWQLDYEPEQARSIEPLMGWTSSSDMKQQLSLRFHTKEEAIAYCERKGIPYQLIEPRESLHRQIAYADNFAFRRSEPWTH
jgi:hypothetical protein